MRVVRAVLRWSPERGIGCCCIDEEAVSSPNDEGKGDVQRGAELLSSSVDSAERQGEGKRRDSGRASTSSAQLHLSSAPPAPHSPLSSLPTVRHSLQPPSTARRRRLCAGVFSSLLTRRGCPAHPLLSLPLFALDLSRFLSSSLSSSLCCCLRLTALLPCHPSESRQKAWSSCSSSS